MKYTVSLEYLVHESVEVEADSPQGAVEAARDLSPEDVFGTDFNAPIPISRLDDGEPYLVHESESGMDCTSEAGL